MVDRIKGHRRRQLAIGIKNVGERAAFRGSLPGHADHAGGADHRGHGADSGRHLHPVARPAEARRVYFMTIDEAKFRKPVTPGDTIEYHVRKARNRGNIWKFAAEARVDGTKVAEATISALIADE
jgi:3-hydroxyacyl-[acyl-carrier-protein] dehydratase